MPTKGKTKGNSGELKIAKFLTSLFESQFMRVPNSGAALGGVNSSRRLLMSKETQRLFKGDIVPPGHLNRMVIESKFYATFPFEKLSRDSRIPQLDDWIEQASTSADKDDMWFLVVRIDRKGSFVLFERRHLADFEVQNHAIYFDYVWLDFESFFARNKQKIAELCTSCIESRNVT
jgi:hypothetical protein